MMRIREFAMVAVLILFLVLYSVSCDTQVNTEVTSNRAICTDLSDGDCIKKISECEELCGCDGIFTYDESREECVVNIEHLKEMTKTMDHINAERLNESNDRVFRGLIGSALFVMACATVCVISTCVYCCHMHYSDLKLHNDIKALSKKLDRYDKQGLLKKSQKKPLDRIEESCNVMVADTDIMCV